MRRCTLDDLLVISDFVGVDLSLNKRAKIFSLRELSLTKESACLVNTLKERMIDEKEFTKALKEGKITGVTLDFLSVEPPEDANYREWTMLFLPLTLKGKKPLDIVN